MGNQIKTVFLMACLTVVIMLFGQALGGGQGLKIAFAFAILANIGAYWFSDKIVLAQSRARLVERGDATALYELVEHLAERANLPTPRVAIIDDPSPNAFATGRDPRHAVVAVTMGLLNMMNREELAGVLGHELTHVKNRDILIGTVAAVLAGVIMMLAQIAQFGALFGGRDNERGNPIAAILMAVLAPLAAALIQAAISRSREYLADDGGADIAGTPYGLAAALEKLGRGDNPPLAAASPATAHMYIVNPLNARSFGSLFATHPPLDERIARLRGEVE